MMRKADGLWSHFGMKSWGLGLRADYVPWATGPQVERGPVRASGPVLRGQRQREYPQPPPPRRKTTAIITRTVVRDIAHHLPPLPFSTNAFHFSHRHPVCLLDLRLRVECT